MPGRAKVGEVDLGRVGRGRRGKEESGGFDVAVDYRARMYVVQCAEEGGEDCADQWVW